MVIFPELSVPEQAIGYIQKWSLNQHARVICSNHYYKTANGYISRCPEIIDQYCRIIERQLARIKQLTRVFEIFSRAELSQQHAFLRVVFKHGFTFFEGVVRTPWIHPAYNHNLLIIKEERLLFLEQPNQNSGGIPRGGAGGTRLEPQPAPFPENEDYLLLLQDLLDTIEAMEKSSIKDVC